MSKKHNSSFLVLFFTIILLVSCQQSDTVQKEIDREKEVHTQHDEADKSENDTILHKGDKGDNVKALQENLIEIGYPIRATGSFDEDTTWALTDLQLQSKSVDVTGIYEPETKKVITAVINEEQTIDPGDKLPLAKTTSTNKADHVLANPYEILVLVNKEYKLPSDFVPEDLVTPNVRFPFTEDLPKKQLRSVAAKALEDLFKAADEEDLELFAQSGYRSYDRQAAIFTSNVEQHGEEVANQFSARPGESEHQSGLTMDVTSPDVDFDLTTDFGETKEGKWLKKHAEEFGFIIRYPEEKEDITGYQYEPWHLRYVGIKAAKEINEEKLTLEEYLSLKGMLPTHG